MATSQKRILLVWILALLLFPALIRAQADCANAVNINVNSSVCDITDQTILDFSSATLSSSIGDPCNSTGDSDLWYTATVPASGSIGVAAAYSTTPNNQPGISITLFSTNSDCDELTIAGCGGAGGGPYSSTRVIENLAPGSTVYIQTIYTAGLGDQPAFVLTAYDADPSLPVPTNGTSLSATPLNITQPGENIDPVDVCFAAVPAGTENSSCIGEDVKGLWYEFVVPTSGLVSIWADYGNLPIDRPNLFIELWEGDGTDQPLFRDCLPFCSSDGFDPSLLEAGIGDYSRSIEPGDEIFLRIVSPIFHIGEGFELYLTEPDASQAPVNDLCENATIISLQPNDCIANISDLEFYTLEGATYSGQGDDDPACPEGDIWFRFSFPTSEIVSGFFFPEFADGVDPDELDLYINIYSESCDGTAQNDEASKGLDNGIASFTVETQNFDADPGDDIVVRVRNPGGLIGVRPLIFDPLANNTAPANDDCANATPIPVSAIGAPYSVVPGCFAGSTASGETPFPTCDEFDNTTTDVWYSVEVPSSGYLSLQLFDPIIVSDVEFPYLFEVYSGSCGNLTAVECSKEPNDDAEDEEDEDEGFQGINLGEGHGISPGETLLIRIWQPDNTIVQAFDIVAFDPFMADPPANDICTGAEALTVFSDPCEVVFTEGTFEKALDSGPPTLACGDFDGADVWYTATVPTSGELRFIMSPVPGSKVDGIDFEAYTGTCGNLTPIKCNAEGRFNALFLDSDEDPISAGQTIYLRAFPGDNDGIGRFNIAAYEPGAMPNNDDCASATELTVTSDCSALNPVRVCDIGFSLPDASDIPFDGCLSNSNIADIVGDIWYQLTVPSSGSVVVEYQGAFRDEFLVLQVFNGSPCNGVGNTYVTCTEFSANGSDLTLQDNIELGQADGISAGDNLYIQLVYLNAESDNESALSGQIYAYDSNGAPANDNCGGAIELPVLTTNECVPITFCNFGASDSGLPIPDCTSSEAGRFNGPDVWFKVTVPANGIVALSNYYPSYDNAYAIYTSDCGSPAELICERSPNDDIGLAGRTPGEELLVRFFPIADDPEDILLGAFDICAYTAPAPPVCGEFEYRETMSKGTDEINFIGGTTDFSFELPQEVLNGGSIFGGTLYISGRMDIDEQEEFVIVTEEGGNIIGELSSLEDNNCSFTIMSYELTAQQIAAWAADGTIEFDAITSFRTGFAVCNPDEELNISLIFCYDFEAEEIPVFTPGNFILMMGIILFFSLALLVYMQRRKVL